MTKLQIDSRRNEALDVLKNLARKLQSLTADMVYVALVESGFSEDEACRLTGALFRTAKANGWITKTDFSVKSKRNNSNLQSLWISNIQGKQPNGRAIPKAEITREYARWRELGYGGLDHLAISWKVAQDYKGDCDVSYQQPPNDSYYGVSVMHKA